MFLVVSGIFCRFDRIGVVFGRKRKISKADCGVFKGLVGGVFGFFEENIDFFRKIGHLKNGLRIALRLFYKKIRALLCFGVGKVEFQGPQNVFLRGRLGNFFPALEIFFRFLEKIFGKWREGRRL